MRVLITDGAGFVGANVAVDLAKWQLIALDNLRRRGPTLNVPRLQKAGVALVHGDVREPADVAAVGRDDVLIDCSAPSFVLGGADGSVEGVVVEHQEPRRRVFA